jgi:hypothetical protein
VVTNPGISFGLLLNGWLADFLDVPGSSPFHPFVEKLVRDSVTAGCGSGNYCASSFVTRGQMAVFLLRSKDGPAYTPPPCTGGQIGYGDTNKTARRGGSARRGTKVSRKWPPSGRWKAS